MTGSNLTPGASMDTALATDGTELPRLWAQTHALRALADLLDRLNQPGLALTISDDRITVQVPDHIGAEHRRSAVVADLAAALGTGSRREAGHVVDHAWLVADADLAGHPVHVFTPLDTDNHDNNGR